jgi:hypothetical protein
VNRFVALLSAFLTGIVITLASQTDAQEPNTTREDSQWGEYLSKNPEVMGVHLATMNKKIAALESRADAVESRADALERRKPQPMTSAQAPFSIRDKKGRVRFLMVAADDTNATTLVIVDDKGRPGLGLTTLDGNSEINLYSGNADRLVQLRTDDDVGRIRVEEAGGMRAVDLDGSEGVRIRGKDGSSRVQLSTDGTVGHVDVYSQSSGYSAVQLRTISTGAGRLTLTDGAGTMVVDAGTTPSGVGLIKMGPDGNGVAAVLGNAGKAASSLQGKK